MLKYYNYDIVFQEVPDETSLALNITGCPNHCDGCHSPWLWEDIGEILCGYSKDNIDDYFVGLDSIVNKYASSITCVCFMGGDQSPEDIELMALHIKKNFPNIKTAWYSGREEVTIDLRCLDYLKIGPYIAKYGGLRSKTTNQKLYKVLKSPNGNFELKAITF